MVLAAFLPNGLGVAVAGFFAFIGGLMFIYGMISALIRVILNDPSQALPMVVSRGARRRVQQRDDDDPFRQMITQTFMERGKTIMRGLLLMVCVIPAVLLNTGRRPVAPAAVNQPAAAAPETTVAVRPDEDFGIHVSVTHDGKEYVGTVKEKLDDGRVVVTIILTGEVHTVPAEQVRNYTSAATAHAAMSAMAKEKMVLTQERMKERQGKPHVLSGPAKIVWSPNSRGQVMRDGEWRPVRVLSREENGKIDVSWMDGSGTPDTTVNVTELSLLRKATVQRFKKEIEAAKAAVVWRPGSFAYAPRDGKLVPVIIRTPQRKGMVLINWADRPRVRPHEVEVSSLQKTDGTAPATE